MQHGKLTPVWLPSKGYDGFCNQEKEETTLSWFNEIMFLIKQPSCTAFTTQPEKMPQILKFIEKTTQRA